MSMADMGITWQDTFNALYEGFKPFLPYIAIVLALYIFARILLAITIKKKSAANKQAINYKKRHFLVSKNELNFYRALEKISREKNLLIFSKVRLADLIEPLKNSKNWQADFNRIKSKHVDFILCDRVNIEPLLVIELDDSSHDRADRQQRDNFVDEALESADIKILHTRTVDKLEEKINALISPKKITIKK